MKLKQYSSNAWPYELIKVTTAFIFAVIAMLCISISPMADEADKVEPTMNAAVNDGTLSVHAEDAGSGVKAIYVNGYEYTNINDGWLHIRLQQFDAGCAEFSIQAEDNAGNTTPIEKVKNPYYQSEDEKTDSNVNLSKQLPVSAEATKPTSATATVTEHVKTDSDGNVIKEKQSAIPEKSDTSNLSLGEQKKLAMAQADSEGTTDSDEGKEFYTIQADTGKVFYLVIDRDENAESVYFLTEISENDLLNVTTDNSQTLPQNSIGADSAIPNSLDERIAEEKAKATPAPTPVSTPAPAQPDGSITPKGYLVLGIIALIFIAGAWYIKFGRKKEENFLDEDDDSDEDIVEVIDNTPDNEQINSNDDVDDFLDRNVD